MTIRKRRNHNPWKQYMLGNAGDKGFYITTITTLKYGPFINNEVAEFFNLIAFCNPRSMDLAEDAKKGIEFYEDPDNGKHPKEMIGGASPFANWWNDTFGVTLTTELVMSLAKESGAKGYTAFTGWLLNGCQIGGQSVHTLIN